MTPNPAEQYLALLREEREARHSRSLPTLLAVVPDIRSQVKIRSRFGIVLFYVIGLPVVVLVWMTRRIRSLFVLSRNATERLLEVVAHEWAVGKSDRALALLRGAVTTAMTKYPRRARFDTYGKIGGHEISYLTSTLHDLDLVVGNEEEATQLVDWHLSNTVVSADPIWVTRRIILYLRHGEEDKAKDAYIRHRDKIDARVDCSQALLAARFDSHTTDQS